MVHDMLYTFQEQNAMLFITINLDSEITIQQIKTSEIARDINDFATTTQVRVAFYTFQCS